jgi:drug/metabolite transporter (DMT)-like permease
MKSSSRFPARIANSQYTLIVWAIVPGYVVFGDVPDPLTLLGGAVIIRRALHLLARTGAGSA